MSVFGNPRDWSDMGISDRLRQLTKKAEDTAAEHRDQIKEAVEKAEVTADQRTSGKYHDQITSAAAKAQAYVDKLEPDPTEKPTTPSTPPTEGEPPAGAGG
jgi:ABC-type transporter Mla subunit MlaD